MEATVKTSVTDPLRLDSVLTPVQGKIGLTFCPGKKDLIASSGPWDRDLNQDLEAIAKAGYSVLVTLVQKHELVLLEVPDLGERANAAGLDWFHLPIEDMWIPDELFESNWITEGAELRRHLQEGRNIAIHCRGGLGRAGTITARLLVELGVDPISAICRVRAARPGAIETSGQQNYVLGLGKQ